MKALYLGTIYDLVDGDLWRPDEHTPGERQYKWRTYLEPADIEQSGLLRDRGMAPIVIARQIPEFTNVLTTTIEEHLALIESVDVCQLCGSERARCHCDNAP